MRILFVTPDTTAVGGIQNAVKKLIDVSRGMGAHTELIERKSGGLIEKAAFVVRFIVAAFRFRPDLIVCTHIHYVLLAYGARILLGSHFVLNFYGLDAIKLPRYLYPAIRAASRISATFQWTATNLIEQLPDVAQRTSILPNTIDGGRFIRTDAETASLIQRHGLAGKKVIFTIARLATIEMGHKGYDRVIEALPRVLKQVRDAVYILAGEGDDRPRVERLIHDLGLEGHVLLVGSLRDSELVGYYNLADVFALPSKDEGFPAIVILEALACGVPIVGGNRECSVDDVAFLSGELGVLVDPDDRTEIAGAISAVLLNNTSRTLLRGDTLRQRTLDLYGLDRYTTIARHFLGGA